ncbi:UNVERIFIED_CONTAM: hypothetical protein Sradi_5730000 [Sesamum radiatum]|uniref:Zinc finger, CCHC-type n=1 Tax=Sesamum radiatum TaxID=300843 RepID=A0AAW2L233_SESRA
MIEGSSVQEHGVKMLSLVEKLKDLKADLAKETYIDVILQSLPPSFDSFIVNYNMNGLDRNLHELINMLVQYEATIEKSAPSVLVGKAESARSGLKGPSWEINATEAIKEHIKLTGSKVCALGILPGIRISASSCQQASSHLASSLAGNPAGSRVAGARDLRAGCLSPSNGLPSLSFKTIQLLKELIPNQSLIPFGDVVCDSLGSPSARLGPVSNTAIN